MSMFVQGLSGALLVLLASGAGADDAACRPGETRGIRTVETRIPPYPRNAALFCVAGYASFEFTIGTDGRARDIELIESKPEGVFDDTGQILRSWTFEPACEDGKAIEHKSTSRIEFSLDSADLAHCPESLPDDLLDALITITALQTEVERMINSEHSRLEPLSAEPTLPQPYADIERAYRRFLSARIEREQDWRKHSWSQLRWTFSPLAMQSDDWPARAGDFLDQWIAARTPLREQWPQLVSAFQDHLRSLTDQPGLDPLARKLLLERPIASLDGEFAAHADVVAIESAIYDHYRELVEWFSERQQDWAVEHGELRFASEALAAEYQRRRSEIASLHDQWNSRHLLPNRVYWSAIQ